MSSSHINAATPVPSFADLGVPSELIKILEQRRITVPLPVQIVTFGEAVAGKDLAARAPTGSGKTLAFGLPMISRLSHDKMRSPTGLILAPTRELAAQISNELSPLAVARNLRVQSFYGGVGFSAQLRSLRKGTDIAVACPGRLEDLMRSGRIQLGGVKMVVVDEADRMADMGFLPAVRGILDAIKEDHQTLLFSATLDNDVKVIMDSYQHNPTYYEIDLDDESKRRITHQFHIVEQAERTALCAKLISAQSSTVVFVRTKHGADRLAKQLSHQGINAAAIHGDLTQNQRERALTAFRKGTVQTLVATDVAARGVHVDDVGCVIHYDLPENAKSYLHRSGRTARAGAKGTVVALVTPKQRAMAKNIKSTLKLNAEFIGDFPSRKPTRKRDALFVSATPRAQLPGTPK
ncbi:MAG: DEAD/DEAH box helicase [Actinobacteria bacterium]|nr:DEAD/DEAH box helicase [Actinomycetota bacterium]